MIAKQNTNTKIYDETVDKTEQQKSTELEKDTFLTTAMDIGYFEDENLYEMVCVQRKFVTQMAELHTDTEGKAKETVIKSTTMYDSPEAEAVIGFPLGMPLIGDQHPSDVGYLVGRPFNVGTISWNTNQLIGTNLIKLAFPFAIWQNTPQIVNLLRYYGFFRPEVTIVLKVNGTPMHYGKLMCTYGYPTPMSGEDTYSEFFTFYNQPWLQVSANSVRTASMKLPYLCPFERIPTSIVDDASMAVDYQYADFNLFVAIPLQLNGDGNSSVDIALYMVIDSLGESGLGPGFLYEPPPPPPPPRQFTAEMASVTAFSVGITTACEAVKKAREGVLMSGIVSDLGRWFDKFRGISYIGAPASVAGVVAKGFGALLERLGFSVPPNTVIPMPVFQRSGRLMQMEDVSEAVPLAPLPYPFVTKDISILGSSPEDYDISTYCRHMMLIENVKFTSDNKHGDILYAAQVRPVDLSYDHNFSTGGVIVPTRVAYLQSFFDYWRGSLRYHVSSCASRFHSGRIRITWIPSISVETAEHFTGNINDTYLAAFPSIILDVSGDTDVSFTVPFHQSYEWANTSYIHGDAYAPDKLNTNGIFLVTVVNSLVSNDSTSPPGIYLQIFAAAGPDFQFGLPSLTDPINITRNHVSPPPLRAFQTQSLDVFSSDALSLSESKPIINYDKGSTNQNVYLSTHVTSLKQLMNMGGLAAVWSAPSEGWYTFTTYLQWNNNGIPFTNYNSLDDERKTQYDLQQACNYFMYIRALKAMARGAYRLSYVCNSGSSLTYVTVQYVTGGHVAFDGNTVIEKIVQPVHITSLYSSQGHHVYRRYFDPSIAVDVPYYSTVRAIPHSDIEDSIFTIATVTFTRYFAQQETLSLYLSCGDDFQFSYDIPMPYIVPPVGPLRTRRLKGKEVNETGKSSLSDIRPVVRALADPTEK